MFNTVFWDVCSEDGGSNVIRHVAVLTVVNICITVFCDVCSEGGGSSVFRNIDSHLITTHSHMELSPS